MSKFVLGCIIGTKGVLMDKIKAMFRAFKYRNFRLFFPGLAICQIGIWIQNIAISWLVYDITKSPFMMGTVMFFNAIPLFIVTPFAGVIVDKFNRHKLLFAVQLLFALQALLITLFTVTGFINIPVIIVLGVFLNCIAAIDAPLRQSTFVLLVDDKKDLSNAISLNASCFNMARFVGPAIGGMLIAYTNIGICFLINFLCILPNIFLVRMMKIVDVKSETVKNSSIFESLKEEVFYTLAHPEISLSQLYLAIFCFMLLAYPMLMPIYTSEVLHANADVLGFILGATGVGSLIASLLLAIKMTTHKMRTIMFCGCLSICGAYIFLGFINHEWTAIILMFFAGLGMTCFLTPQNMLVQNIVADDKRGRVMSMNALCYGGTISLSSFIAGSIAETIGIAHTFVLLGGVMFGFACYFSYRLSKFDYTKKI